MIRYSYSVTVLASKGETCSVTGNFSTGSGGIFMDAVERAMKGAFESLMMDGVKGPFRMKGLVIQEDAMPL